MLSFEDRHKLLACLENLSMDSYLYAPKEDICHRFDWRRPYREGWLGAFASFCADAQARQIQVLAGMAPGLDFNFAEDKADFAALLAKARQMLAAGADALVLMFDDISDDISAFTEAGLSEGLAHARLANRLQQDTGRPVVLVPRLYADEIDGDELGDTQTTAPGVCVPTHCLLLPKLQTPLQQRQGLNVFASSSRLHTSPSGSLPTPLGMHCDGCEEGWELGSDEGWDEG